MKTPILSIVILSYNTKKLLNNCIDSILEAKDKIKYEIIVVDNYSNDGSPELIETKYKNNVLLVKNNKNIGFAKGNNSSRNFVRGKYVLFLNPDTELKSNVLDESIEYIEKNEEIGALTCKVVLPDGTLDKDTRRSFPTPWVALTHFSKLDNIFPKSKLFSKYWYGYISENTTHQVDSLQGAFFLVRKDVLDKVNWFDEDYFLDGEDIDLCWKIKQKGWQIVYFPKISILHLKGSAKGKNKSSKIPLKKRLMFALTGVKSMEIFYKKRLWKNYNIVTNLTVILAIQCLKIIRIIKITLSYL